MILLKANCPGYVRTRLERLMLNEGRTRKTVVSAVDGTFHEVTWALGPRVPHGRHHVCLTSTRARIQGDGADAM